MNDKEDPHGIGAYYERCRVEGNSAHERYLAARAAGVTGRELQKLEDEWMRIANTGD